MRLNTVVLPAPFGPINPYKSPVSSDIVRFFTATKPPKRLVQFRTSSIAMPFSNEPLRTENHDENQENGKVHQPESAKTAKHFQRHRHQNRSEYCAFNGAEAAHDDHDDQVERRREQE